MFHSPVQCLMEGNHWLTYLCAPKIWSSLDHSEVVSDNSRKIWSGNMWCTEIVTNLGDEVQAPNIHQTQVGTENCNQHTYVCREMIGNGPRKCNRVATLNLLYHCKASWNISQPISNASFSINFRFSMKSFWCVMYKKLYNPLQI